MNGPTLTLGEFRELTRLLPDNTPLTAYDTRTENWVNLELTAEAVDIHINLEQPSLILDLHDDFDTRQW